jgi:hypothetical protein
MNSNKPDPQHDIQPEYDFTNALQGKHHQAYREATNLILLDQDVAEVFKDSTSVNEALRLLLRLAKEQSHIGKSA